MTLIEVLILLVSIAIFFSFGREIGSKEARTGMENEKLHAKAREALNKSNELIGSLGDLERRISSLEEAASRRSPRA